MSARERAKDLRLLPAFLASALRSFSRSTRSCENCSVSSRHLRCNAARLCLCVLIGCLCTNIRKS